MSAAGVVSMGINFVVIGFVAGVVGYLVDFMTGQTLLFNLSYGTLTTINYITLIIVAFPFLFLLMSIINYIVVSASETGGYA